MLSMRKSAKTYITADGRLVGWRWARVPVILWLMVTGCVLSALTLVGRVGYLLAQSGPIRPDDDFNLTVFLLLLSGAGASVFSLVIYLLARPEEATD